MKCGHPVSTVAVPAWMVCRIDMAGYNGQKHEGGPARAGELFWVNQEVLGSRTGSWPESQPENHSDGTGSVQTPLDHAMEGTGIVTDQPAGDVHHCFRRLAGFRWMVH